MISRALLRRKLLRFWERRISRYVGVVFAVFLSYLCLICLSSSLGVRLETQIFDALHAFRGSRASGSKVVLAVLDEASFHHVGVSTLYPFPREKLAQGLEAASGAGVKAAFIDLVFAESGEDREADLRLEKALAQTKTFLAAKAFEQRRRASHSNPSAAATRPHERFMAQAAGPLPVALPAEAGVVRHFPLELQLYCTFLERAELVVPGCTPAPDADDFINYLGAPGSVATFSFYQLLQEEGAKVRNLLRDSYVFIGVAKQLPTGLAAKDSFLTPVASTPMAGVEIMATVTENLLAGNWIRQPSQQLYYPLSAASCFLWVLLVFRLRMASSAVLYVIILAAWVGLLYLLFLRSYFLPSGTVVLLLMPLALVLRIGQHLLTSRGSQRWLERMHTH